MTDSLKLSATRLFIQQILHANNREKHPRLGISGFLTRFERWTVDSLHKWSIIQKAFPSHDVMTNMPGRAGLTRGKGISMMSSGWWPLSHIFAQSLLQWVTRLSSSVTGRDWLWKIHRHLHLIINLGISILLHAYFITALIRLHTGRIRLSVSTASRTYELSEVTHVTPFLTYRFHLTGLCNYKP